MTATVAALSDADLARRLLKSAANAAAQLESDVRALVAMRAWEVLGYENFSEMWEKENGFKCPPFVQVLAVDTFRQEGMRPQGMKSGTAPAAGLHTNGDVGRMVGLPVTEELNSSGAKIARSHVAKTILRQLDHGVPPGKVVKGTGGTYRKVIEEHGTKPMQTRARPHPRRLGKGPDEFVNESVYIVRRDADAIAEIARKADVTKSEIYRQAVAEYLARYRASRPVTFSDEETP